jgi:hypothetical protein
MVNYLLTIILKGNPMSVASIPAPTSYVWDYTSEHSLGHDPVEALPEDVRHIIYGFLGLNGLTGLYSTVSHNDTLLIGQQLTLLYRIEIVKAASIKNSLERAKRLHEIGKGQAGITNISEATITADRLQKVPYLRISLLCEIGKALAHNDQSNASKQIFTQAKKEAEELEGIPQKVFNLVDVGTAELESNDPVGANESFAKAETCAMLEDMVPLQNQFKRRIEQAKARISY